MLDLTLKSWKRRLRSSWPALRMSGGLVSLCVSVYFIGCALGFVPDRDAAVLAGRKALCESLAVHSSLAAQKDDLPSAEAALKAAVERNPSLLSAGLRIENGKLIINLNNHNELWDPAGAEHASETQMQVPIMRGDDRWCTLELRFAPLHASDVLGRQTVVGFVLFFSGSCFAAFFLFLRPAFAGMASGGSETVPQRVKSAMDSLAEAVLILDKGERIAMANAAFSDLVGVSPADLRGKKVSDLPFFREGEATSFSWQRVVEEGEMQTGVLMGLKSAKAIPKLVSINSTPILADDGSHRGIMATFDNLTNLERKHAQLRKVLDRLRDSRRVVRQQNQELKMLATRDPLTGCFNRRTLFAEFEKLWEASTQFQKPLSCVLVDVDHFKSINDRFGHQVGDEVLKQVAETLRQTARKSDIVCRYGGEEFCVLLPDVDLLDAALAGERFRKALAAKQMCEAPVTASFGVSSWSLGAKNPQEMMDQSDKALYAAKRTGRNKVVRFDLVPEDQRNAKDTQKERPSESTVKSSDQYAIPFQAVSGLLSALSYRHAETAEHCRRVADLCVAASDGIMPQKDAYVLEMAALLHDIGKLGVPDHVLLKAGPLTPDEWKVIHTHEKIGVEIVRTSFTSEDLAEIMALQHCWYAGSLRDPSLPKGQAIPLAARLLAIANAYDSMTSDAAYRKAMLPGDAVSELRRCAGSQFDAALTEHFIQTLDNCPQEKKTRTIEMQSISKQTVLRLGVQIEKLALAVDGHDLSSLISMAGQLRTMAQEGGVTSIADAAGKIEQSAAANSNQLDLMELTLDLLELCRHTQRSLLPASPRVEKPKRVRPKAPEMIDPRAAEPTIVSD
jgi:diguanylate cyclase (GGDEF)-like protein/putative nucleotidyltransferase with HDIG domain/PAS domain S-box-containing protein